MVYTNFDCNNTFNIHNESSLQKMIVRYLRQTDLLFTGTLGGYLETDMARINAVSEGYGGNFKKGIPDLIIFSPSPCGKYNGMAIELKHPRAGVGKVSKEQLQWLDKLEVESKYFCMISNSYDEVLETIVRYMHGIL